MSCPIAEALRDPLSYYKKNRIKSDFSLESLLSKDLLEGKLYVEENPVLDRHRHVQEHRPGPEAYAGYTAALIELEESVCSK